MKLSDLFATLRRDAPPLNWIAVIATAFCTCECYVPGACGYWFIGLAIWFIYIASLSLSVLMGARLRRNYIISLAALVGLSTLSLFEFPKKIAFNLSKNELDKFAEKYRSTKIEPTRGFLERPMNSRFKIGVLPVLDFYSDGKGSVFIVTGTCGFIDTDVEGFAYNYKPIEMHRTRTHYIPISQNWTQFESREHF